MPPSPPMGAGRGDMDGGGGHWNKHNPCSQSPRKQDWHRRWAGRWVGVPITPTVAMPTVAMPRSAGMGVGDPSMPAMGLAWVDQLGETTLVASSVPVQAKAASISVVGHMGPPAQMAVVAPTAHTVAHWLSRILTIPAAMAVRARHLE